jgi:hypothetical protein
MTSFVQRDTNAYQTFKKYSNIDRMLIEQQFLPKQLTQKQLYKEKLMKESDDLVAQNDLIK